MRHEQIMVLEATRQVKTQRYSSLGADLQVRDRKVTAADTKVTAAPGTSAPASTAPAATVPTIAGRANARARFNVESGADQRAYRLQNAFIPVRDPSDSSGPNVDPPKDPVNNPIPDGDKPKPIDIQGVKNGTVIPTSQELVDHVNALRKIQGRTGDEATIKADDLPAFQKMTDDERRFFATGLYELDKIIVDKDPKARADYQFNMMQHAADIAGKDGQKFINLVQAGFSAPPDGYGSLNKYGRDLAGTGASPWGQYLEGAYSRADDPQQDYNPLVRDKDNGSSVTHHFGEFMKAHGIGWDDPYDLVEAQDSPEENPGDVRNGFFAVMIGDGLRSGEITPQQATDLTRWAFAKDSGATKGPPWGTTDDDANKDNNNFDDPWYAGRTYNGYLNQDQFKGKLNDWVNKYNEAHA